VLGLLIITAIITQTSVFKSWLSDTLSSVLSESISAEVEIGQIDGSQG